MVTEVKVREPVDEAVQGGGLDSLGAADDAEYLAEVESGQVVVAGLAGGQVEGEVGCRGPGVRSLGQCAHPSGRPLQEADWTHQLGPMAAENQGAHAQHQPMSW